MGNASQTMTWIIPRRWAAGSKTTIRADTPVKKARSKTVKRMNKWFPAESQTFNLLKIFGHQTLLAYDFNVKYTAIRNKPQDMAIIDILKSGDSLRTIVDGWGGRTKRERRATAPSRVDRSSIIFCFSPVIISIIPIRV
jgi:hypothetical protein